METPIDHITSISESAKVKATYDGFRVKISISVDFEQVECACYLYIDNKVFSKSGYRNNRKHVFYFKRNKNNELAVKVFFRDKSNSEVKRVKLFPISIKDNFKYEFSKNSFESITLTDCEIVNSQSDAIIKYEKKGFQPRGDNIPYKLTLPIGWLDDPFQDRNWMFQLQAWRMLDGYLSRGNAKDLNYVSKVINDWVDFEKSHKDKWLWYDMSTGLRALKICFYLKRCYEVGVDHQIEDLDYLLHEHLKHLSNPAELNFGNHGLFQLHGLKSLTYILRSCDNDAYSMSEIKAYANEKMSNLIASQLGSNGVHTEDSPDYHFFTHKKITNIVVSPWWSDLDANVLRILELGEHAKPWLVFPNKKCVPIGDSAIGAIRKNLSALEEWPHVQKGAYIGAQVDGYAVVRSVESIPLDQSSFLFFQGSFYSQAHKHCDDLSFILQEDGIDLLIDSGKYGYQQDKYRKYFLSTRAHNTIEVDDKSTTRNQDYAYGSAIVDQPICINGVWILKGCVNHKINRYIHQRTIVYKPGMDLYVIDIVTNKKISLCSRKLKQWWHFETDAEVYINNDNVMISTTHGKCIEITSESSNRKMEYSYYRGYETEESMSGWVSKSYLKHEPTSTISVSTNLRKCSTILTRFNLDQSSKNKPIIYIKNGRIEVSHLELYNYIVS